MIPHFMKAFEASAPILGRRIVIFSDVAASDKIATAAGPTTPSIGISAPLGALATGDQCDVVLSGIAQLQLGGTVTAGAPIMPDASGCGIVAIAAAATTRRVACFALQPGVIGDWIDVFVQPHLLDRA